MHRDLIKLPSVFIERLRRIVPSQDWTTVANTFTQSSPTTLRANTLKISASNMRTRLESQGFRLRPVNWYKDAFILQGSRLRELQKTDTYTNGEIYVQNLSSMIPALILDPQPGESVLDLTAAPGSKTTQLACLMNGKGRIVANDNNKVRFFKLKANIERQGVGNVELSLRAGEAFGRTHPDFFDRVLLDAPCSSEGRFQVNEPASYRYWKIQKIKEMVYKQKGLLMSAIRALRPGGCLVYSTCTFAPEENEGVIDWAIKKCNGTIEVEAIRLPVVRWMRGLNGWGTREFTSQVKQTARIIPTAEMEGFFIARMRKSGSMSNQV